jgi:hypothetical protein
LGLGRSRISKLKDEAGRKYRAYGGDMEDKDTNDDNFVNGVVSQIQSRIQEHLKLKVYQDIIF